MKHQPNKTLTRDYGLFIVTVRIEKRKPIEDLMNDKEKQLTGLAQLTPEELANLNEWLDPNNVVASDPLQWATEPVDQKLRPKR